MGTSHEHEACWDEGHQREPWGGGRGGGQGHGCCVWGQESGGLSPRSASCTRKSGQCHRLRPRLSAGRPVPRPLATAWTEAAMLCLLPG